VEESTTKHATRNKAQTQGRIHQESWDFTAQAQAQAQAQEVKLLDRLNAKVNFKRSHFKTKGQQSIEQYCSLHECSS
jgi:hypothetical protein